MYSVRRLTAVGTALAMLVAAAAVAGCGDGERADPTPVQTFKITPAAGAATATPPPAATAPAGEPTSPATAEAGGPLTITGVSSQFDLEEITAPAGSVTVEFDNRDGGVVHNIHFFSGDDADGESVAETELEVGPITQTVTFDAEPGSYFYQCDAHPTTMTGTLTVQG